MVKCPNCHVAMVSHPVELVVFNRPAAVGSCVSCSLLWFDQSSAVRLAPRSVLAVFQYIGTATRTTITPLASRFNCPDCAQPLQFTNDLQRLTRFTYWRCDTDHGQLISFHQFLREKNFIRSPTPAELIRLRETVRQVSCSQCGGSIDLTHDSACSHCGAAVALIDPDGIAKALNELRAPNPPTSPANTADAVRNAMIDAHLDAMFQLEHMHERDQRENATDLVAVGFGAIGALIQGFLTA